MARLQPALPEIVLACALFLPTAASSGSAEFPSDLSAWMETAEHVDVIVQFRESCNGQTLAELFGNACAMRSLKQLDVVTATVDTNTLWAIIPHEDLFAVSIDRAMSSHGAPPSSLLQEAIGLVEAQQAVVIDGFPADGRGVKIALLDPGYDDRQIDVLFREYFSMVPDRSTTESYGRGTHVASIAAGRGSFGVFGALAQNDSGVAPHGTVINVKMLDDKGQGKASWVPAGIDWVLANHQSQNIRVVNVSLGESSEESYKTDPLCQATKQLQDAGIVTIVSAGNFGEARVAACCSQKEA